ncbi:MAG: hypothetical protein EAZ96_15695 [Oscillatoriales cyanobacterium]|nr:MAG: hypothetical protein EAZ96_15695 [Oscillatoriales cyanobacterium]
MIFIVKKLADRLFKIPLLKKVRYALCPMPYALCPMPYAHEYLIFLRKAIYLTLTTCDVTAPKLRAIAFYFLYYKF